MTINQQLYLIRLFATNHKQINYSLFSPEYDIHGIHSQNGFILWWYLEPSQLNQTSLKTTYVFTVMDVLNDGKTNLEDILSDSLIICTDLITYLEYHGDEFNPLGVQWNYSIDRTGLIEPGEEMFNSRFAGHTMRVTFEQGFAYDNCAIPAISEEVLSVIITDNNDNTVGTVNTGTILQVIAKNQYNEEINCTYTLSNGILTLSGIKTAKMIIINNVTTTAQSNELIGAYTLANLCIFGNGTEQISIDSVNSYNSSTGTLIFNNDMGGVTIRIILI